jgi:hypothetical protein
MPWFSAMVVLTTNVETVGPSSYWRSVFVFREEDRAAAKSRAIELGEGLAQTYRNGDGQLVVDKFNRVQTLDELGERIEDGTEVWSEGVMVEDPRFDPFAESVSIDFEPGSAGIGTI